MPVSLGRRRVASESANTAWAEVELPSWDAKELFHDSPVAFGLVSILPWARQCRFGFEELLRDSLASLGPDSLFPINLLALGRRRVDS